MRSISFNMSQLAVLDYSINVPGICSATSDDDFGVAQGGADAFVADTNSSREILGFPLESYRKAPSIYREELSQRGAAALLERAYGLGSVPDEDPMWLSFSPFGWHCMEFMSFARNPEVEGFLDGCHDLQIACYGGGLHDETEYIRYRYLDAGLGPFHSYIQKKLASFHAGIFGPVGKVSYEPRELLSLFLSGNRKGELHVFDNQPELAAELERPTLPLVDWFGFYYRDYEPVGRIQDYYHHLSRGRDMQIGSAWIPTLGDINYSSFELTSQEMSKVRLRSVDMAVDSLEADPRFHVSVWLESQSFFDEPLRWIVLSKIVRAMHPGAYLLTNPLRQGFDGMVRFEQLRSFALLFGLEFKGLAKNHAGTRGAAALYRRVSKVETPAVEQLAGF